MRKNNSVKVCIRTRPTQYFAQNNIFIDEEHSTVQINTSSGETQTPGLLNNKQSNFKFKFDHVFHNASQSAVYDLHARDTVQGVVDGINGAIMSYGQTGSGKTFTMIGDVQSYEHRGIAPRAINQLFNEINSRVEFEYKVTCTFMEIYNERIYDLLNDLSNPDQAADYTIAEEKDGRGTFVRGLAEVEVKDENSMLNLLFSGGLSRTIATHKLNKRSNRSHSVFTVYLQQRQRSGVSERVVHSKLHLVDLAGSERLKKTMDSLDGTSSIGEDVTRRESMAINQSLTYLEQCVVALARRSNHIPYRQSKLTNILKDCLGANCNTVMIACMWGESSHLEETVSTLRLASRMMRVVNETVSVETVDPSALIKKQEKIIKALKQELLMHDALIERTGVVYDPYTPEQQESVGNMIERYVEASDMDEEGVLDISNYRQMMEICKQFKKKILTVRLDLRIAREQSFLGVGGGGGTISGLGTSGLGGGLGLGLGDTKIVEEFDPTAPFVGEVVTNGKTGFSLGISTSDSRPVNGIEGLSRFDMLSPPKTTNKGQTSSPSPNNNNNNFSPNRSNVSIEFGETTSDLGAFETYAKNDIEGHELYREFVEIRLLSKESRLKHRDLCVLVNQAKETIDRLVSDLEERKKYRIGMETNNRKTSSSKEIVDEDELRLVQDLKEAKRTYKNCFEQMQRHRNQTADYSNKATSIKKQLADGFQIWSSSNNNKGGGGGDPDQLDDQEAFDRLEIDKVLANDPDSLAFFNAQKVRRANITQNGGSLKQLQKNKRFV